MEELTVCFALIWPGGSSSEAGAAGTQRDAEWLWLQLWGAEPAGISFTCRDSIFPKLLVVTLPIPRRYWDGQYCVCMASFYPEGNPVTCTSRQQFPPPLCSSQKCLFLDGTFTRSQLSVDLQWIKVSRSRFFPPTQMK